VKRFGDFEFSHSSLVLSRRGERIRLTGQPLELLLLLLERPGELIPREEIQKRLWPDTHVDFDHGLDVAVSRLRAALGDSGAAPRYLETIPRKGLRFIAPVTAHRSGVSRLIRLAPYAAALLLGALVALGVARSRYQPLVKAANGSAQPHR